MKKILLSSIALTSVLFAETEVEDLRKIVSEQQKVIEQLQKRLDALEAKDKNRQLEELKAKITQATNTSAAFNQTNFLPDISFILNASAVARDVKNSEYIAYSIPGFIDKAEEEDLAFNKNRGFNFNYAELALHSAVDPYLDAFAIFHLHPNEFEIEEAFVTTRSLPYNLRVKAGKFRSDFGRINAKHQHSWHFDTQPLVYKAMLGTGGINDAGIQLQWIAPTDTYLMFGIEAMQGSNERSFGYGEKNSLYVGYIKTSIDVSDTTLLAGASIAHGKNVENKETDIYGLDLTTRTYLDAYSFLTWQSEALWRHKEDDTTQAGLYTQLVYQINRNYSCGVRYDTLFKNSANQPDDLDRYTAMIEYKPFEMSRLRLQYSYDRSKMIGGVRKDINEVIFSINIEAGAHDAHAF
ncbi:MULTISPECIES: hypothetical protein [unclassified Nitratiruptor]|uniref:hypothetical protein n=1 Tax=unclassified Nitratiruptor TaxID=2624044 RepID=UPI001915220A|nr:MULTISPECIES: hypothetical protein [unclassified Nitratiruptor]BCD59294.1 hypothetical protein NitYY0810_C0024 [Nitratiruptor sp. YY08-10]BCD63218.1 hypothetical protein NitYY0814_C0024 [Nitratiruptor sp. YY08-14]